MCYVEEKIDEQTDDRTEYLGRLPKHVCRSFDSVISIESHRGQKHTENAVFAQA